MKVLSQAEIEQLIGCPKEISEPPKKEMRLEKGSLRNNMRLRSTVGEMEFTVFMRVNEDFHEDFSIGLDYHPADERGSTCLLRCNGPHGEFLGNPELPHTHFHFHIHKAKFQNMEAGLRAERGGEKTEAYASYEQALQYFLQVINVTNADKFFPDRRQLALAFEKKGPNP